MTDFNRHVFASIVLAVIMAAASMPAHTLEAVPGAPPQSSQTGTTEETALSAARLQLEHAFIAYQQGDTAATEEHLKAATEWLNKAAQSSKTDKARAEARQLAGEIDSFKKNVHQTSRQDENSLARFWHRATSIIKRETDQLIHSYAELSNTAQVLKHLLDAKLHLFTVEHDLFVSHNEVAATEELDRTLAYLDEAAQTASPAIRDKVLALSSDIQSLKARTNTSTGSWKKDTVVHSLDEAVKQLEKAKSLASPATRLRIASLSEDVRTLRADTERHNIRIAYDAAMASLKNIIHEL